MKLDQVASSGNDEFYTPLYAVEPLLKYIPTGASVWCPFDTDRSLIVSALAAHGCKVTYTHIDDVLEQDFFAMEPRQCEFVISNPPYSLKTAVFQRLFEMGIPFAMLVGVVGLFESEARFSLFETYPHEIMWLNKRIAYFKSYDDEKPVLNPPFSSVWLTSGVLPRLNVFERVNK